RSCALPLPTARPSPTTSPCDTSTRSCSTPAVQAGTTIRPPSFTSGGPPSAASVCGRASLAERSSTTCRRADGSGRTAARPRGRPPRLEAAASRLLRLVRLLARVAHHLRRPAPGVDEQAEEVPAGV